MVAASVHYADGCAITGPTASSLCSPDCAICSETVCRVRRAKPIQFLSPSPLALLHDFVQIRRWTYLDCSTLQLHSRMLGNELNCVIQISRFKHLNSTQLLLRFRVRTVCHCNLSVLPTHGHRPIGGLKRFLSDQMFALPQFVVVAKTLVQHGVALALRHVFELAGLEIAQTDVSFGRAKIDSLLLLF